ncbi:serine/threonine protein kinase [bacterium]|nr:serine/threonine protein kinase [bacterium]
MKTWWLALLVTLAAAAQSPEEVELMVHTRPEGAEICWGRKRFVSDFKSGEPIRLAYGPEGPLYRQVTQYPLTVRKAGFRELKAVVTAEQLRGAQPVLIELGELEAVNLSGWLQLHPWVSPCAGLALALTAAGLYSRGREKRYRLQLQRLRALERPRGEDTNIGRSLGRYHVVELLGVGGMARVYRAVLVHDPEQQVALKLLSLRAGLNREARLRYHAEVRIQARLRHLNLALLYEPFELEGELGLVMELLRGRNLRQGFPVLTAQLLDQISSGMSYLHEQKIIHRDLKPENLFLTDSGILKIMDLGISVQAGQERLTTEGAVLGTLAYMSPEQIQGQPLGFASDQYSLGIILYEWLVGELPFQDETPRGLAMQHLQVDPVPPSYLKSNLSPELDLVLLRMLAKQPGQRYPSLLEALADLRSKLPAVEHP